MKKFILNNLKFIFCIIPHKILLLPFLIFFFCFENKLVAQEEVIILNERGHTHHGAINIFDKDSIFGYAFFSFDDFKSPDVIKIKIFNEKFQNIFYDSLLIRKTSNIVEEFTAIKRGDTILIYIIELKFESQYNRNIVEMESLITIDLFQSKIVSHKTLDINHNFTSYLDFVKDKSAMNAKSKSPSYDRLSFTENEIYRINSYKFENNISNTKDIDFYNYGLVKTKTISVDSTVLFPNLLVPIDNRFKNFNYSDSFDILHTSQYVFKTATFSNTISLLAKNSGIVLRRFQIEKSKSDFLTIDKMLVVNDTLISVGLRHKTKKVYDTKGFIVDVRKTDGESIIQKDFAIDSLILLFPDMMNILSSKDKYEVVDLFKLNNIYFIMFQKNEYKNGQFHYDIYSDAILLRLDANFNILDLSGISLKKRLYSLLNKIIFKDKILYLKNLSSSIEAPMNENKIYLKDFEIKCLKKYDRILSAKNGFWLLDVSNKKVVARKCKFDFD
jgi:hypothetical protein